MERRSPRLTRRTFLSGMVSGAAASLVPTAPGALAEALIELGNEPQQLEAPLSVFDRLITPIDAFFVRSHFGPPRLERHRAIRVHGRVEKPLRLDPSDLGRYTPTEVTAVTQCAGSGRRFSDPRVPGVQWGHGAMGQATWGGVRLADVLEDAGVQEGTRFVGLLGADLPPLPSVPAFHRSLPFERAMDPSTLIAVTMNGQPIDLNHGAPARLVVPGWAADHWLKWLVDLEARADDVEGYFVDTAYRVPIDPLDPEATNVVLTPENTRPVHELPVKSVIASPSEGATLPTGDQEVVGVGFSGHAPLAKVEVSFDGGAQWEEADLEGEPGIGRWQVFRARRNMGVAGAASVVARATDAGGHQQPERPIWNPSGYLFNGWHRVDWWVS